MDLDVTQIVSVLKKEGPKMLVVLMIIAILKVVVYYSIGRTHGGKFQFLFPDVKEWAIIIIATVVINYIGMYVVKNIFSSAMPYNRSIDSDAKNMGAAVVSYAF
jgi:hypothetical protein